MYYCSMDTFEDIIQAFGGPAKYGEAIRIEGFHAQTMKQRGSIPPAYWADTVAAASERHIEGVTLERLAEIAKAKRPQTEGANQ